MARRVVVQDNMLELIIFSILALFMLGGAITMITSKQTLFSAFGFLITMVGLAGMFALLDSRFLAIAQIMVSIGAVVVLSLLTILTINVRERNLPDEPNKYKWIVFSSLLVAPITFLLYKSLLTLNSNFSDMPTTTSKVVGKLLFSEWVLPFEIVSILLLTAMLGAIIIVKDPHKKEEV